MTTINDRKYTEYKTDISWGNFSASLSGGHFSFHTSNSKKNSKVPLIRFNIENNIIIGLEFAYSGEMFKETSLNKRIDISKYLSDITYEDNEGWISIITGKYECYITRINEKEFRIELNSESNEFEELNININTITTIL